MFSSLHSETLKSASCSQYADQIARSLDRVPTGFLKRMTEHIAPVICYLCILSLQTGIFPATLKHVMLWFLVHPRLKSLHFNQGSKQLPCYLKFIILIQASRKGCGATFHITQQNSTCFHPNNLHTDHSTQLKLQFYLSIMTSFTPLTIGIFLF